MSEKLELNTVLAKIERSLNIWVKTRVFYAIKTERVSLQNKYNGVQLFITANKTKQNLKQKLRRSKNNTYHKKQ